MIEQIMALKKFILKKEFFLFLFLIAAIAATRSYTWFNNYLMLDDVNHILDARVIYSHMAIPVMGPSLAGRGAYIPGGGYYILLSIPALLFSQPVGFFIYSAVLMICSAAFFLFTISRHYGTSVMLLLASLLLFSPRMMLMESGMWNPYYAVMLSLILASILIEIFSGRDDPLLLFLLLPLSALMSQVHFTAFFYLPLILAVYFIFFYRGRNSSYFWLGTIGAVLIYLPYLFTEIGNHFHNTLAILSMREGTGPSFPVLSYLLLFPSLDFMISGYISDGLRFLATLPWYALWPLTAVYIISLVLTTSAFIYCVWALFKERDLNRLDKEVLKFYFLVLGGLVFAFTVFGIPSYPTHYYYPAYSFSFFPMLLLFRRISQTTGKLNNLKTAASALFITAGSILSLYYFVNVISPFSLPRQYGYINALLDDANGRPFDIRTEYEKFFYEHTARDILHRAWNEKPGAVLRYIIDKKVNLTNNGTMVRIYGDDLMGLYRVSGR